MNNTTPIRLRLALSVRQPWASLIVAGIKTVENRSWYTNHRGLLLIHAALTVDVDAYTWLWRNGNDAMREWLRRNPSKDVVTGAVIGRVNVDQVIRRSRSQHCNDPWFIGPYGFLLSHARQYRRPVPITGRQGLFSLNGRFK